MAEGDRNLTGVWLGLYSYPRAREPVTFTATLMEAGSSVSGTVHETVRGVTYTALLDGARDENTVAITKVYDDAKPHGKRIVYQGMLSTDGTEIEGRWIIPGSWSGKFLMIRSAGPRQSVIREVFEKT